MSRLIDLDAVVGSPIRVKLRGEEYKLPPDLPAPTMLLFMEFEDRVAAAEKKGDDSAINEALRDAYEEVLGLFQVYQPELETLPISMEQITILVVELISEYSDESNGDRPTKPTARSKKNSGRSGSRASARSRS